MKKKTYDYFFTFILILFLIGLTDAEEGMFPPSDLKKLPFDKMKKMGLKISADKIYSEDNPSIKDAIILLGGGTAEFISSEGLILTNHHVAFDALQQNSTPAHDYIHEGYLAENYDKELKTNYSAQILESIKDVTNEILGVVKDHMSVQDKYESINRKINEIQKTCSKDDLNALVATMNNGVEYHLYIYKKLDDVRVVYAPPRSVGEYGGEIDNWMWPRHTGDFAIFRAYCSKDGKGNPYSKDNIPFKPKHFLKFSTSPIKEGDFAFIMGFPGTTYRYRTSYEIRYAAEINYPFQNKIFKALIESMELLGKSNIDLSIKYASNVKGFYNVMKKYQGMIEGIKKYRFLDSKIELEKSFSEYLAKNPEFSNKYGNVLPDIKKEYDDLRNYSLKQMFINFSPGICQVINYAMTVVGWSLEKNKKDEDRAIGFKESDIRNARIRWKYQDSGYDFKLDKLCLEKLIIIGSSLPEKQRFSSLEKIITGNTEEEREVSAKNWVKKIFETSQFSSYENVLNLLDSSYDAIHNLNDPFFDFANEIAQESKELMPKGQQFNLNIAELRFKWMKGLMDWKKSYFYPDANRMLRFTYGTVKGYSPRDAITYRYYTTLSGVIEKESGEEPFKNEKKLLEIFDKKDFGNYFDKTIGDIPTCFLTTTDITGGNSGSPVLDGNGNLIGCAFDGDYESMTSDYLFDPKLTRTINVDSRYILFVLDKYSNAKKILNELVIVK